jgi:glycosyltransferase involved in cell wall biosynthesis
VIALSSEWLELAQIVPGRPVFLLENAIDLAPYQAIARERHEWQALDGPLHVLYLGYIWKAKGSFDLVEAARQVSENNQTEMLSFRVVFELVGSEMRPPELQQLAALIHESGLEGVVSLHPPVFGEEKLACFRRAGVFVYPSYSEGMPMAVIEAMASGLPVIASRAGGLPDLVQDAVTGLLVDPGKPEQLAAALDQLIHDPALRQSMGEQGARLAAQRFDIEQHAARLVEIYYGCLSSDRNSV